MSLSDARIKFQNLLDELEQDKKSGMITYIDSTLNRIGQHVRAHPEVLPTGTTLDAYIESLDAQVRFIWEVPGSQPHNVQNPN